MSMSCSISSTVTSSGSASMVARISWRSASGTPAAGSSSSSTRGLQAKASAISEQPLLAVGQDAGALAHDVGETEALEQVDHLVDHAGLAADDAPPVVPEPSRSEMASPSVSSGVRSANSWLIWNVRVMPSRTRSMRLEPGDVLAVEQDLAGGRAQHAGEQVDERGLAGAVRADQRMARALLDAERYVVRRDDAAEALVEADGFENDGVIGSLPPAGPSSVTERLPGRQSADALGQPTHRRQPDADAVAPDQDDHDQHRPIQNCQYCGVMLASQSCMTLKMTAPISPP